LSNYTLPSYRFYSQNKPFTKIKVFKISEAKLRGLELLGLENTKRATMNRGSCDFYEKNNPTLFPTSSLP
jgi:hypothetical protein